MLYICIRVGIAELPIDRLQPDLLCLIRREEDLGISRSFIVRLPEYASRIRVFSRNPGECCIASYVFSMLK
jgi:hypothetical protein